MYFSKNQKEKYYMEIDILFKEYDLETLYKENILAKTAPSILTIFSAILTGLISYCIGKDGGIFWFLELISFVIIFWIMSVYNKYKIRECISERYIKEKTSKNK